MRVTDAAYKDDTADIDTHVTALRLPKEWMNSEIDILTMEMFTDLLKQLVENYPAAVEDDLLTIGEEQFRYVEQRMTAWI
jgi:hypothetical protein